MQKLVAQNMIWKQREDGKGGQPPCIFMHPTIRVHSERGVRTDYVRVEREEGAIAVDAAEDPGEILFATAAFIRFWMEPGAEVRASLLRMKGGRRRRYTLKEEEGDAEEVPLEIYQPLEFRAP